MDRKVILRRRAVAVLTAVAATALIWLLFSRGGGEPETGERVVKPVKASAKAKGLLADLNTEQKVAQVMLVGVGAIAPGAEVPGGYLVDEDSWPGAAAGRQFTDSLRAQGDGAPLRPLIAARQEGGEYRTLADLPPEAREIAVGDLGETGAAQGWSRQTAAAMKDAGFDLNLAPVADVATLDSPIADRAFSDDSAVVRRMTLAAMRGCKDEDLACAPSHFPGLGGASEDTDLGPATVSVDQQTLLSRDLPPFEAAFGAGAPAVVVSHAFYAAYDPVTPASLSPAILDDLLRDQAGFKGAAITDDLEAGAILAGYRVPDAAVAAIAAGADMVQVGDPGAAPSVARALLDAVAAGTIPPERLDDAAAHVIDLKRALGLV